MFFLVDASPTGKCDHNCEMAIPISIKPFEINESNSNFFYRSKRTFKRYQCLEMCACKEDCRSVIMTIIYNESDFGVSNTSTVEPETEPSIQPTTDVDCILIKKKSHLFKDDFPKATASNTFYALVPCSQKTTTGPARMHDSTKGSWSLWFISLVFIVAVLAVGLMTWGRIWSCSNKTSNVSDR